MKFTELCVNGSYLVEPEAASDERGFFARTWCSEEFAAKGLDTDIMQCSVSFNRRRGTLRGMHYQQAPYQESKLVRFTAGVVFDVVLDLRQDSGSYLRWDAVELSAVNHSALYIPKGCAHGFMTLVDDCELFYQISVAWNPDAAAGVRWDDPAFAIDWPFEPVVISGRDGSYPEWNTGEAD